MSSVVVITPLLIANWPVITAAVTSAIASMGFSIATSAVVSAEPRTKVDRKTRAEIDVEDSEILSESASRGGEIVVERDGVRCIFTRDARGALKLCVEGEGHSKLELKKIGQELIGRVTQQYAYNRVVTELQERGMAIVDEEVAADRTVKLRVRNL
jgi:hypothetical protein